MQSWLTNHTWLTLGIVIVVVMESQIRIIIQKLDEIIDKLENDDEYSDL